MSVQIFIIYYLQIYFMFVTIEGIDKSGKSTLVKSLNEEFKNCKVTKEPKSNTSIGKEVRKALNNDNISEMTTFFLFMADHAEHIEQIKEYKKEYNLVLCDRYIDSRYAYQSQALQEYLDNPLEWMRNIQESGWSIFPDLTIYLDISANEAMNRVGEENLEKFENIKFQKKARQNYKELTEIFEDRIVKVDATKDKAEIIKQTKHIIQENK